MLTPISSVKQMVKISWLQLTPFIKSVALYFVLLSFDFFNSNILSTIVKCLPIFCLMAFTFFMGFKFTKEFRYQQKILVGLFFSSIGDAFLDYNEGELFPFGMLAFAVAQISYISAFRWKPFRPFLGLILFVLGGFAMSVMFKNFEGILLFGVPIYSALLLSMCWRANARIQITNLPKILAAIGGVCFVASDSLIAFDMFYSPIEHSKIWVMSTYYIAQMGITLSILDHEVMTTNESAKSK